MKSNKPQSRINAAWHKAHRMPADASIEERIVWHLEHARNCPCRKISRKLKEEMEKRQIEIPK